MAATLLAAKCPGLGTASEAVVSPVRAAGDSSNAAMFGMRAVVTYQSQSRGILSARVARQYDEGMRFELDDATFMTRDSAGRDTVRTTAPRVIYDLRRPRVEFIGGVVSAGNDGRTLRTARASFDPVRNVLSSETSFVYTSTNPSRRISGNAFDADARLLKVTPRKPGQTHATTSTASPATRPATRPATPRPPS